MTFKLLCKKSCRFNLLLKEIFAAGLQRRFVPHLAPLAPRDKKATDPLHPRRIGPTGEPLFWRVGQDSGVTFWAEFDIIWGPHQQSLSGWLEGWVGGWVVGGLWPWRASLDLLGVNAQEPLASSRRDSATTRPRVLLRTTPAVISSGLGLQMPLTSSRPAGRREDAWIRPCGAMGARAARSLGWAAQRHNVRARTLRNAGPHNCAAGPHNPSSGPHRSSDRRRRPQGPTDQRHHRPRPRTLAKPPIAAGGLGAGSPPCPT